MLSDNAKRLEAAVMTTLTLDSIPTEEQVASLARQLRAIPPYAVDDEEFAAVIRRLHTSLRISMGLGNVVREDHAPWVSSRRAEIDPFYARRYFLYLKQQGWPAGVLGSLDKVTDEILDVLGNPASEAGWPRRGLVMGDVQSGKTSNYTGLICKAADAGYKLVILLTGTLESLRRQTQERLDSGFVGLDSSGVITRQRKRRDVGVGVLNGARSAGVFTSTLVDFRADTINHLGFRLNAFNEPVLLVVKKNKKILENLTRWLKDYNADQSGSIDSPLLVIDDEADNASVNTNPEKATAINHAIRELLKVFPRSSYVGFTATPFANVFIHPETEDEMLGDDLFPKDFIYALDAPSNYIGAQKIFSAEDEASSPLRPIFDAEIIFPAGHKAGHPVSELPESLTRAVNCFLLANATMDLRKGCPRHRSMLVNVSHFTLVQDQVRQLLDEYVRTVREDVRSYSRLSLAESLRNPTMATLHDLFNDEYGHIGIRWTDVAACLSAAVMPVEVRAVNQKSGAASLDYQAYKENGLRVIAVGGNSLSRGLTLEGLCVSYFYRTTKMYDALLQMGRWFGYRDGYADICRIWMSDETSNWYGHIADATEELRREIRRMQLAGLKPIDFGLKVRSSPEALPLLITARNKMRHSEEIEKVISISNEAMETYRLKSDPPTIAINAQAGLRLIDALQKNHAEKYCPDSRNPLWLAVPKSEIVDLLKSYSVHPMLVSFNAEDIAGFVAEAGHDCLATWDVVIPQGNGQQPLRLADGLEISPQKRAVALDPSTRSILVNEKKMRVGSRGVEKYGLTEEQIRQAEARFYADPKNEESSVSDATYRGARIRPLLALHFLDGFVRNGADKEGTSLDTAGHPLLALGLSFPRFNDSDNGERIRYRVNMVEWHNNYEIRLEEEGDDEEDVMNDA
ncbi:Z1 domain-containing protein [Vogesella indigofera]|uniref:Z1 domain-containing protein n=1 Tax=Vogesella indigofera TaxID=45465 RepID=A0A495BA38_VOGIN|nr:Z1 domain-containing protein [Vogesella indigofera]RKQ57836.1 Z1 domain-containing protein [Vogesella indigofera]